MLRSVSRYWERIKLILRQRGWRGLARFLWGRLVWRRWHTIIFTDPIGASRAPSVYPEGFQFQCWLPHGLMPAEIRRLLAAAGAAEFLAEIEESDGAWVLLASGGRVAGWGGIYVKSPQARLLSLPADAVLLGGGFIVPYFRGQGLHRQAVNDAARYLALKGHREVYTEVHPDNIASLKGLEGAQLMRVKEVKVTILFWRLALGDFGARWI